MYIRNGNWVTEFYHEGVRYKKALGAGISKTVAKEREARFKQEVREGKHLQKARRITFEKFAEKYLDNAKVNKRPKSAKRNAVSIGQLMPYFKGQLISTIHSFQAEQYKRARREAGASPATVNRDVATLRNMMNRAVDWKYLRVNPLSRIKMLEEVNEKMWVLSPEEEDLLLDQCAKSPQRGGRRYLRDLVEFALYSGMRLDEIFSLIKVNVHLDQNYLFVVNSKSHRSRSVPINETLKAILLRRMEMPGEFVFTDAVGQKLKKLTGAFWYATRQAGLTRLEGGKQVGFRFHDLRHSFGSRLGMSGVDLKSIMEIMGHSTAKMAMRYQHPSADHKLEAVRSLDKIGKIFPPKVTPLKNVVLKNGG
jgi:integrase